MKVKSVIRNLLIGKDNFILSRAEYKSAILRAQIEVVTIIVCLIYIVIDFSNGISIFTSFYLLGISVSVICIYLNRQSHYQTTNFILLITANFLAYIFASNDTYRAGTYIYLIVCCLLAFALYGYKYRIAAVLFCFVSVALFALSYVYEAKILLYTADEQKLVYSEEYVRVSFITNFLIALVLCSLIFHFLLSINFHSENEILVKNDLLLKTNQELDRFVYSASHDLKAPLSSMLGLIEIALRTEDPEEIKMCLGMMRGRINILDDFIREIIDYSRNARLELKKEKFSLMELTKEVIDDLKYAEGFENIYLKYNIPPDLEIVTDRARLRVVLSNLIGNSLKYHDPAKENPNVEIAAVLRNNQLRIEVQDNGLGISEEHKPKIFEMFYRASEKSKGSGLGLYIVSETIKKLNGDILVTSKVGHGSSFEIVIPI